MDCLVTGGAGFIGSHLVERLLDGGHRVRVLDDFLTGRRENLPSAVELIEGSVADPAAAERAAQGVECAFHLAAVPSVTRSVSDPLATHAACLTGTLCLLEAARRAGVHRVVYASSSSVYGDRPGDVRSEDDPLSPASPYAAAKLAGEYYCLGAAAAYGLQTVRLRFFNVFGPRQRADSPYCGVVARFTAALLAGVPPEVHGDGRQSRDFTYVADVVGALILAATSPAAAGRVYNVGAGGSISVLALLSALQAVLGTSLPVSFLPARPGDVRHSRADVRRARAELGYCPAHSLEQGLRLTVEGLRGPCAG